MLDVIGLVLPFFGLILIGFVLGKRAPLDVSALGWMNLFIVYVALQMCWTGLHDVACLYVSADTCRAGLVTTVRTLMSGVP